MVKKIREEVVAENVEKQKRDELEEFDLHRAQEFARMQTGDGKKAGRPPRSKTRLIADMIKLVRDRQSAIKHQLEAVQASVKEASEEAARDFPQLPGDLESLQKTMVADVDTNIAEIQKVHDALDEINVNELVTQDKISESALKEKLVNLVSPVSKKYP